MISFDEFYEQFSPVRKKNFGKFGRWEDNGEFKSEFNPTKWKQNNDVNTKDFIPHDQTKSIKSNISNEVNTRLDTIFNKYGFSLGEDLQQLPTSGNVVYRGHKDPDPFSKGGDALANEDKVYFGLNPRYTWGVYSRNYNGGSKQIGQSGGSSIQWASKPDVKAGEGFDVGFFTIATPKDPDNIGWYRNFGYEDGEPPISKEQALKAFNAGVKDLECVESEKSFTRIRTYLTNGDTNNPKAISFERLKKISPPIYNMVMSSRTYGKDDPNRVY